METHRHVFICADTHITGLCRPADIGKRIRTARLLLSAADVVPKPSTTPRKDRNSSCGFLTPLVLFFF